MTPLALIFKYSLDLGIFPDSWKGALVRALLKTLKPSIDKNYKPLKVFEKAVLDNIYPYLITNKLLTQ